MSDYGALLKIKKLDGSDFTKSDVIQIQAVIDKIKVDYPELSFLSDYPVFLMTDTSDPKLKNIILSEYWYGDGDNEELFEFTLENDEDTISMILDLFVKLLSRNYTIDKDFCNW